MELLDPKEAKTEKDKKEAESTQILVKLNDEITNLTKKINDAREEEKREKIRIKESVAKVRNEAQIEISKLELEVSNKRKEVEDLEERKKEALKPVEEIKAEQEALLEKNKRTEAELGQREAILKADTDTLQERTENVTDRETLVSEKEANLDIREKKIADAEAEAKRSANELSNKWAEFHKTVAGANADIARREKEVDDMKNATENVRIEQDAERIRLRDLDKAVKDKYVALAQAKKHLGIK